jgi:hypothetical protein
MRLITRRGKNILMFAMLLSMLFGATAFAQDMEKPGVAIYVIGDIHGNERKVLGTYLFTSIVKNGHGVGADGADAFLATAMSEEQAKSGVTVNKSRICELGRQFSIRYICLVSVTSAFNFFVVSTNMVDTETEDVIFVGEAQSPLKTMDDLTQVSDKLVESMFGVTISGAQPNAGQESTQSTGSAQNAGSTTDALTAAVSVAGEAKAAVDRVVAAINAFKAATDESIAAANAVKTATQAKSFSAIKEAKKKVESATEAVKKAKTDVTAAIDALNSAGPEAAAAVKALGIDLSMFAGKEGGGAKGDKESTVNDKETTATRKTKNGLTLGYVFSGDANIFQAGFAQTRPISDAGLSFVWETNIWGGYSKVYYVIGGLNVPLLIQFDLSVLSLETGLQADILCGWSNYDYDDDGVQDLNTVFNAGFVVGGGIKLGFARFFYRFNYGTGYYSQMFGIRMMF